MFPWQRNVVHDPPTQFGAFYMFNESSILFAVLMPLIDHRVLNQKYNRFEIGDRSIGSVRRHFDRMELHISLMRNWHWNGLYSRVQGTTYSQTQIVFDSSFHFCHNRFQSIHTFSMRSHTQTRRRTEASWCRKMWRNLETSNLWVETTAEQRAQCSRIFFF